MEKLIRDKIVKYYNEGEFKHITNQSELNHFYALKIYEELDEIQRSDHKDVTEFADLIQVAISFANANGFTLPIVMAAVQKKAEKKGEFSNITLLNLNPNNPSNKMYLK